MYPQRQESSVADFDFYGKSLTFEELDTQKFPCFKLALQSAQVGGNIPCAMNGANEQAVKMYLENKIKFYDISRAVEYVLEKVDKVTNVTTEVLLETDKYAREMVKNLFGDK